MSNENWIKFEEEMPKLNDNIEAIFEDGKIEKLCMETDFDYNGDVVYFCLRKKSNSKKVNLRETKGWRPLKSENLKVCIGCLENFYPTSGKKICKQCSNKGKSSSPSHEYKTHDWTLFTDALPLVAKEIEVEFHEGQICKTKLESVFFKNFHLSEDNEYLPACGKAIKWRYKKERRPDFSNLKKGDIISFNMYEPHEKVIGIISVIDDDTLSISPFENSQSHNSYTIFTDNIKKIIRINLENQTCEEI